MKITKQRLKELITEEVRSIQGQNLPNDIAYVDMPDDLHNRTTSLWEHLNGLLQKWTPTEEESTQCKKDLFTLMNDFLKSPDRPSPGAPEDSGHETVTEERQEKK